MREIEGMWGSSPWEKDSSGRNPPFISNVSILGTPCSSLPCLRLNSPFFS